MFNRRITKLFFFLLILSAIFYFLYLYIKWGFIESFFHYPTFDEEGLLNLAQNVVRYGRYELQFNYYSVPKLFNPFISNGPPLVLFIATVVKFFGFHYYISNLFVFFFINLPLIFFFLLNIFLLTKKTNRLHKLIILTGFFIYLITDRLFYASPPTGGSFTHGAIGEPLALLLILIALFFEYKALQTKNIIFIFFSGITTALSFQTKIIVIIFVLVQSSILALTCLYFFFIKKEKSIFYTKILFFFFLGFALIMGFFNIYKYSQTKGKFSKEYSCWQKVVFYSKGSGINNLYSMDFNKFKKNIQNGLNTMVEFYSVKVEPRWEANDKNNTMRILSLNGILLLTLSTIFIWKILIFLKNKKKLTDEKILNIIMRLTLGFSFFIGTVWFFMISDFSWIRHYYFFYFLGVLYLAVLLDDYSPERLLEIAVIIFIITRSLLLIPQTPFYSPYTLKDIDLNRLEKTDREFIKTFNTVKDRKTYVCGYFTLWEISFLTGINFNNILEDAEPISRKCESLPKPRLKNIEDKRFNYVFYSEVYPECKKFIDKNKDKLRLIYNQGYMLYTTP